MNRLGFHYFHDTQHYRQYDLNIWLPRLKALGTRWLVLTAPTNRTIPETFIKPIVEAGIQPLLHFPIQLNQLPTLDELKLLFNSYQRWGVRYVTLFDQPNTHKVWSAANWVQADLVERFLDLYLPFANTSLHACLTPIFPPLKPGGDYWDTAFLRRALESMQRRGQNNLLEQLVIGAYSIPDEHPLQWGAGGPERWPNTRPYFSSPGIEDQRGFRIFDWYAAISQAALSSSLPIFLFGMGYPTDRKENINRNLTIIRLLEGEYIEGYEAVPEAVIGGAFRFFENSCGGPLPGWFLENGEQSPQAEVVCKFMKKNLGNHPADPPESDKISHYLLLPSYEWGISDFHLDIIRPIIKKYQPTIGFSINEARNAERVTVLGGEDAFSEASLNKLRTSGVLVRRIHEDGTDIASILATL